ncbi:MAG: M14 family zinc carboxypeptidase [Myxococcota bacterium]
MKVVERSAERARASGAELRREEASGEKSVSIQSESSNPPWYPTPSLGDERLRYGLRPDVVKRRNDAARRAHEGPHPQALADAPSYLQTYEQVRDALFALQEKYPDLVSVDDVGDSSEKVRGEADRDLWRIRLTNQRGPLAESEKAKVLWTGGMHGREIANPALLMTWIEQVLDAYGSDPEARALLDTRVIDVIPLVNPDGHTQVTESYEGRRRGNRFQRKNTAPPNGTDINRNFSFEWGGPGASRNPRSETYRGPSAASEPETQAIEALYDDTDYDIVVDWHSHSELVLFPWGHTREKAPDHDGLKAIAERFASFNGYTPQQSVGLYPTSGTSDGPSYGERRIPTFVMETGRSFHPSDQEFSRVQTENHPVLTYSAQIADDPYERAKGPLLDQVVVADGELRVSAYSPETSGTLLQLRSRPRLQRVEMTLDPRTPPGEGIALMPEDGRMDSHHEVMVAPVAELQEQAPPETLVYVRGQNAAGHWGPLRAQWLNPPAVTD